MCPRRMRTNLNPPPPSLGYLPSHRTPASCASVLMGPSQVPRGSVGNRGPEWVGLTSLPSLDCPASASPQVQPRLTGGPLLQGHQHWAAARWRQRCGHLRVGGAGGQPGGGAGHPGGRSDSAGNLETASSGCWHAGGTPGSVPAWVLLAPGLLTAGGTHCPCLFTVVPLMTLKAGVCDLLSVSMYRCPCHDPVTKSGLVGVSHSVRPCHCCDPHSHALMMTAHHASVVRVWMAGPVPGFWVKIFTYL